MEDDGNFKYKPSNHSELSLFHWINNKGNYSNTNTCLKVFFEKNVIITNIS